MGRKWGAEKEQRSLPVFRVWRETWKKESFGLPTYLLLVTCLFFCFCFCSCFSPFSFPKEVSSRPWEEEGSVNERGRNDPRHVIHASSTLVPCNCHSHLVCFLACKMESELLSLCWKQTWITPLLLIDDLCLECPADQPPSSSSTCAEASASVSIPAPAIQAQSDCFSFDHLSINLISQVFFPTGVLHWSGKKRQKRLVGVKPILLSLKSWLILAVVEINTDCWLLR